MQSRKRGQERLTEENLHIRNYLENEKHLEQSKASDESLVEGRGVGGGALGDELRWKDDWKAASCRGGQRLWRGSR